MTTPKISYREFGRLTPVRGAAILPGRLTPVAGMTAVPATSVPAQSKRLRERVRLRAGIADLLLFRVANEMFALELVESEEAIDLPSISALPESTAGMLGVFSIRETLVSAYSAGVVLGVVSESPSTALVLRGRDRKVALVVDDVDDVATIVLEDLHEPPVVEADGLILGVFRHNGQLVALLDADTLLASCRAEGAPDIA